MIENIKVRWLFFKHDAQMLRDRLVMKLVWAMPKRVVMWAFYRVMAHATTGAYGGTNPSDLNAFDAIRRWPVK